MSSAEPAAIAEPLPLDIVTRLFGRGISPKRLYEITREDRFLGESRASPRCDAARQVLASFSGHNPSAGYAVLRCAAIYGGRRR
jgi:hypothetical protein